VGLVRRIWGARARVYGALDRPGGRWLLAALATFLARRETKDKVAIVYPGAWFAQLDGVAVAATGSTRFVFRHGREIREAYEWQLQDVHDTWLFRYEPQPGDVIVDVGAGIGSETFVFSRAVGPDGRVLAIEPHPQTFRVLHAQVVANKLANVELAQVAVTATPGPVYIEDRERHERNTISSEWTEGRREDPVDGVPLDELGKRHGLERIDFLKMNIEGAEAAALDGMSEVIGVTRHVCIACHDFLGLPTRDRVTSFLRDRGFTVETRDTDERAFIRDHVHAHKEPA
jgi:FkbM family methyltransferase